MKRKIIVIAVFWGLLAAIHPVFAGEVNIDLAALQGGVLVIPENQLEGEIKVNLSEPVNTTDATVVCHPLESGPSLTAVEFENSTAPVGMTELEVLFRVKHPGRPIQIQCTAQSRGNNTQYTLSGSRGNIGSLQVSKAPTVVICPKVIVLHKYQPVSSIEVQFSEKITGFPVLVNCLTLEHESGELPQLEITFKETYVEIDQTTAKVPYEIKSVGFPVLVTCRARSVNMSQPVVSTSAVTQLTTSVSRPINGTVTPSAGWITTASLVTSVAMSSVGGGGSARRRRRSLGTSSQRRTLFQYWYNNSAGLPVIFALDFSPLRILPSSGFIRAPDGVFRVVLALDQPAENTVDITCSLGTVSPGSDLGNESELCSTPPADTVTFANSSVELKLSVKEIQFEKGELFKNIDLTLTGTPSWRTQSVVRVVCCGKDTGLSLRYNNESAVMFAWVELRKLQPVDWDQIDGGQKTSTSESDVVLDCPCNLRENACDVGCCCDQDCSDFENKSSICIPGFFGGATSERPFEFSCQATWPDATDWQPFLCVAINNSPVIGYFYNFSTPRSAEDTLSYNTLKDKGNSPTHSFSESEDRSASISSVAYSAGTAIKTAANTEDASYARAVLGALSLPNNIFSGLCSQMSPVRFLEDFISSCVHELEESLCTSSSPVSALTYLMPIKLNQPACPFPPAVLAEGRLNDTLGGAPKLAVTEVQYYCMDISEHVSMTKQDDIQNHQIPSLFATGAAKGDSPVRCEFDDGQTIPPAPTFNKTTRFCSNVVVKVEYEFSWGGRQIIAVLAKVTVGNVQIPTKPRRSGLATSQAPIHTISQSFSVKFLNSFQNSSSSNQTTAQRSGNPGYMRGRPVLSRVVTNSTVVSVGHIHLWSPSGDSLCAVSSSTPVLFGQDTFSGCLLRLSHEDLLNCSRLKQLVRTNQDRLIEATHVGRRGNADVTVSDDWLPIVKEQLNNSSESSLGNGVCPGIPSGLLIEMLVSEAGKYRGEPQLEIVGTRVSYQYATWQFKCRSGTGASCSMSASSETNLSVTSLSPSPSTTLTLTNTIVTQNSSRLSINASITNSSGNANAGEKTEARQYRSRFQYFLVSSSVVFIKVPPEKPARLKRTADQTGICYNDVCKEELFYPLTTAYTGEPREKAMALSLFLIFLSFVVFAITRPWG